jgi:hypothetical protein
MRIFPIAELHYDSAAMRGHKLPASEREIPAKPLCADKRLGGFAQPSDKCESAKPGLIAF